MIRSFLKEQNSAHPPYTHGPGASARFVLGIRARWHLFVDRLIKVELAFQRLENTLAGAVLLGVPVVAAWTCATFYILLLGADPVPKPWVEDPVSSHVVAKE